MLPSFAVRQLTTRSRGNILLPRVRFLLVNTSVFCLLKLSIYPTTLRGWGGALDIARDNSVDNTFVYAHACRGKTLRERNFST